jgi:mannose-1-phosphate guanylyltransferase
VRRLRDPSPAGIAREFTQQFISLMGDRSTSQLIMSLVGDREIFEEPLVITNFDYRFRAVEQLKEISAEATILLEPKRRDSR